MPWRKSLSTWFSTLFTSHRALKVGSEADSQYLLVQVNNPISSEMMNLEFPCGQKVRGTPVWSRSASPTETILAFDTGSLGVADNELDKLRPIPETRGSPRLPARLWVSFPDEYFRGTVTIDLSLEGCRLQGDFRDCVGEEKVLYLDLYDSCEPIQLRGKVVWSDATQAGLRFLNLHVSDEVRLLRNLGRASETTPSNFLPPSPVAGVPHTYRVDVVEGKTTLLLSMTNWKVCFELTNAKVQGQMEGEFQSFLLQQSSDEIRAARTRLKLDLERQRNFVHWILKGEQDKVLCEIVGEEVRFHREQLGVVSPNEGVAS